MQLAQRRSAQSLSQHQFAGPNTAINANDTRRTYTGHRMPGDGAVSRQTQLLTKKDPSQQFSNVPAPSQNEHPNWSWDEKFIYFDSDRVSDSDTTESSPQRFNLFRMFDDGSGVTQILPDATNQLEPSVSSDGGRVAYVSGGTISFAGGLDTPTTSGFALFTYDISNGGAPTPLTRSNPQNITFTDVRHPSWSPGGTEIAFAGQTGAGQPYHLYKVATQSGAITQLTTGPTSSETSPAWSPDSHLIAFTSNASGYTTSGPVTATGVNANPNQTDIWFISPTTFTPDPGRITNSSSIVGGKISSNKNPAWSTLKADPLGLVPPTLIAFASTRAAADPNRPGQATDVKSTSDIWFLHARITPDANNSGSYVAQPESVGNAAIWLRTSTPDTAIDASDPSSMFDPNFGTNEDFPAWPQYISSYRIAFQSDRGSAPSVIGPFLSIWASTLFDINAPTLLKYDIPGNEIVHVARNNAPDTSVRELSPGETVRFRVRLVDYESGMNSAFVQIKDPNSQPQGADKVEHKTFFVGRGQIDTNIFAVNAPYEAEAQAINPYDPNPFGTFRSPSGSPKNGQGMSPFYVRRLGGVPAGWPGWNQYLAGIDDDLAFSGKSHPPDYTRDGFAAGNDYSGEGSFWLRIWDDGPISKGGHEQEGEKAGDGVFSAIWTTPVGLPSDWILDVIAYDNAIDPFAPENASNWKIYDNVWGFTTQPFQGISGLLYVDDYDTGQRFFQTHFGAGTQFAGNGSVSKAFNGWPTESWMTEHDPALIPTSALNGTTPNALLNYNTTLGLNAYSDTYTFDGGPVAVTARYDIWRVQCRGPVPDQILNAYKGHLVTDPPDVLGGGTAPFQVFVAPRCVFWHNPYTGDLFTGPGTLLDTDTQVRLAAFVKSGGRILIDGEDLGFGLSLGQPGASSSFLNNTFKVQYVAPFQGDSVITGLAPDGVHPLTAESWYNVVPGHLYLPLIPGPDNTPPSASPLYLITPNAGMPGRNWMCPNELFGSVMSFTAPSVLDTSDFDATWTSDGAPNLTWVTDVSAKPIISKAAFCSFGWEGVNPEFFTGTNTVILKNRRMELMHNAGDYMRTGRIVGFIRDVNGATPLKNVTVRALPVHVLGYPAASPTGAAATALTQSDGSFTLDGLDATGFYAVDATLKGFITLHTQANFFHGGYQSRIDVFLTQAQAGSISGKITQLSTGAPVAGVTVQAQDNTAGGGGAIFTALSQADGTYSIKNLPASFYDVTTPVTGYPGADLTDLGYGSSVPVSYLKVAVTSATDTPGKDFALVQAAGSVSGVVRRHDRSQTDPSSLIAGATVTATPSKGGTAITAITDANGHYSMPTVAPGTYNFTAVAPGFATAGPISGTVTSKQELVVNFIDDAKGQFALVPIPPGSVSGLVETSAGLPVPGATVTIQNAAGATLATTTSGPVQTVTNSDNSVYRFNYRFTGVPAGAAVVMFARKDGYNPDPTASQTVPIQSDPNEAKGINFILDPLHQFPGGTFPDGTAILSLVSAPYEYSGVANGNVGDLFGIPASDRTSGVFAFITWNSDAASYVRYPTPPADTFHLGRGYFLADTNPNQALTITQKGTPAEQSPQFLNSDQPGTFPIALKPGWNMIGDPFPYPLNYLNLRVKGADGRVMDVLTGESGTNPTLGAALWQFQGGIYEVAYTVDPWRGYWLRAFDNRPAGSRTGTPTITLYMDPAARQDRAARDTRGVLTASNTQSDGWKLTLNAIAAGQQSAPAIIGVTRAATEGYDRYKLESPPSNTGKGVTLSFDHPEWADKAGRYSVDIRSAAAPMHQWDFTVTSTLANQPVTINWPNLSTVTGKRDLVITDKTTNQQIDLRTRAAYIVAATAAGVTRHFTLSETAAIRRALQLLNVEAHVNAHRAPGDPGSVAISYTVTTDATVRLSISLNGHRIRTVEPGTSRAAGSSEATWDLRNDQGQTVPSDFYTVEVYAQDKDGHSVRQVKPLLITGR